MFKSWRRNYFETQKWASYILKPILIITELIILTPDVRVVFLNYLHVNLEIGMETGMELFDLWRKILARANYHDNIFMKRSIPSLCFAQMGINPSTFKIRINKVFSVTCKESLIPMIPVIKCNPHKGATLTEYPDSDTWVNWIKKFVGCDFSINFESLKGCFLC